MGQNQNYRKLFFNTTFCFRYPYPFNFFLFVKRLVKDKSIIFLSIYVFIELLLNFLHGKIDNQLLDYFWATFTPIEYLVFTYFLLSNISYRGFKKIIIFSSIFFVVFTIFYNIYADLHKIDSTPIGIESILIFIYSFFYFYEQMKDTSTLFIYNKYHFWIVIGYLIYLSGSFLFSFSQTSWMMNY